MLSDYLLSNYILLLAGMLVGSGGLDILSLGKEKH